VTDAEGRPSADADRSGGAVFKLERSLPPIGPGSIRLALRSAARPHRHTPAAVVAGWLPRGVISTRPLQDVIRRVVPRGWSEHPNLWIVACDYATGRRVPFGREGVPEAELAKAVAASCAIPGFYHPVTIGARRYVDGGLYSNSNLDLLRGEGLDLVICLNPTSTLNPVRAWNPAERLAAIARRDSGRRLGSEAKKLRAAGTRVVLIQPTGKDLEVMGSNLMSRRRRHEVITTAIETVGEQLREPALAEQLSGLPPGDPERVARPPGPPSTWALLREAS